MRDAASDPVLVIDDDDACPQELRRDARGAWPPRPCPASTVGEGLRLFAERRPAAVLLDLKLPDGAGIDVLRELQRRDPATPVVVVSGYGSVSEAVEAMRVGAADFLEKPVRARAALRGPRPGARARRPRPRGRSRDAWPTARTTGWWAAPRPMRRVYQLVEMAAPTKCRVLISGRAGTGQGAAGPRHPRALAAARQALRRDQLRGHSRGADRERDVRTRERRLHRRLRRPARASSRAPIAAPCSWTRSAT